jgi:hypothetical protein
MWLFLVRHGAVGLPSVATPAAAEGGSASAPIAIHQTGGRSGHGVPAITGNQQAKVK